MKIVLKILWGISIVGFLISLFTSYGGLPEEMDILIAQIPAIDKNTFFYIAIGVFLLYTIILLGINNIIPMIPKNGMFIPNRDFWNANKYHRQALNKILQSWVFGLAAVINYFMILAMKNVMAENVFDASQAFIPDWMYIIGLVMLASLITPLFRLTIKKTDMFSNIEE